jgi:hypothetical protein
MLAEREAGLAPAAALADGLNTLAVWWDGVGADPDAARRLRAATTECSAVMST